MYIYSGVTFFIFLLDRQNMSDASRGPAQKNTLQLDNLQWYML